jgi:OOP family OmpA-OmpF porin
LWAAALVAGSAASLPAMAEGLYIGGSVGKPHWSADSVGGVSGDSSGTGLKLYGGWQFTPNFALEGSVFNLGKLKGPLGDAKADGVALDAVGLLPITPQWTALARLGVASVKTKALGDSDRSTIPKFGLGVQYNLTKTTALRGDWEHYRIDAFDSKSNVNMYSVGVNVSF